MGALRGGRRRALAVVTTVLALTAVAGCGIGGSGSSGQAGPSGGHTSTAPSRPTTTPSVGASPDFAGLKVGSYRYVNACSAYFGGGDSVYAVFDQQFLDNAVVQETYAENSLPSAWYPTPQDETTSSCSIEFASAPWSSGNVIFNVEQFPSTSFARANFAQYSPVSKAALREANRRFGTTFDPKVNMARVPGVANTFYQASSGASWTLVGNKIVSFNLGTTQGKAANLAILRKAVPVALKRVATAKTSVHSSDFGKRIGAALYDDPCKVLSSAVFHQATGLTADPTDVDTTFNLGAVSHRRPDQEDGVAHSDCSRSSLQIGKQPFERLDLTVQYYDSAAQARHFLGVTRAKEKDDAKPVSGFGKDAFLFTFAGTSVYVAVGPYVLVLHGTSRAYAKPSGHDLSVTALKKLYAAVTPKLG